MARLRLPGPWVGYLLVALAALPLMPQAHGTSTTTKVRPGAMTDAQAAQLAREALGANAPASMKLALGRLKAHSFKSSKVPERELVLYAQGMLEARLGNLPAATLALKKLERQWPESPFMGEVQSILAEDAFNRKRTKEAEERLHKALASDMPAERKHHPQELLLCLLAEQGRPEEALTIAQALRAHAGKERPSERPLGAIAEVLAAAGPRDQAEAARKEFLQAHPASDLVPRVELAWGRMLGQQGDKQGAAQALRKLVKDHPLSPQADDARLALASLLTDGSLKDTKDLPSAESLLAEVRKGGKALPKGAAQLVELRLLVGRSAWDEALALTDGMEPSLRQDPEVRKLWAEVWNGWAAQRLEKGRPGDFLSRLKPGAFLALDPKLRLALVERFAESGLLDTLPSLVAEAPEAQRATLRRAALAKAPIETQPKPILRLLGPKAGGGPEEALARARAESALDNWAQVRTALPGARPGPERVAVLVRLLQRPLVTPEKPAQRLSEAEGWMTRAPEKGAILEPLAILVADLRFQAGDAKGALALYPAKPAAPGQQGWVALMRAEALLRLGQREQARVLIREARQEPGFKGQRDALARSLGAY